jgi:hypothetical protein
VIVAPNLSLFSPLFAMRRLRVRIPSRPADFKGLTSSLKTARCLFCQLTSAPEIPSDCSSDFSLGVLRYLRGYPPACNPGVRGSSPFAPATFHCSCIILKHATSVFSFVAASEDWNGFVANMSVGGASRDHVRVLVSLSTSLVTMANRKLADDPHMNTTKMLSTGPKVRRACGTTMSP